MKRREEHERMKTSNLILLALGLFTLAFIMAMTVIFCVKESVPDTHVSADTACCANCSSDWAAAEFYLLPCNFKRGGGCLPCRSIRACCNYA